MSGDSVGVMSILEFLTGAAVRQRYAMKTLFSITSLLILTLCSGCGDTHESLTRDTLAIMKEMNGILDGVKDSASAKSAKPKLESLMKDMKAIQARQEKLPTPTEADLKAMESAHGKEMEEVQQKFIANMLRVSFDPAIGAELQDLDMKTGM